MVGVIGPSPDVGLSVPTDLGLHMGDMEEECEYYKVIVGVSIVEWIWCRVLQ